MTFVAIFRGISTFVAPEREGRGRREKEEGRGEWVRWEMQKL